MQFRILLQWRRCVPYRIVFLQVIHMLQTSLPACMGKVGSAVLKWMSWPRHSFSSWTPRFHSSARGGFFFFPIKDLWICPVERVTTGGNTGDIPQRCHSLLKDYFHSMCITHQSSLKENCFAPPRTTFPSWAPGFFLHGREMNFICSVYVLNARMHGFSAATDTACSPLYWKYISLEEALKGKIKGKTKLCALIAYPQQTWYNFIRDPATISLIRYSVLKLTLALTAAFTMGGAMLI